MKKLVFIALILFLSGCTNQLIYEDYSLSGMDYQTNNNPMFISNASFNHNNNLMWVSFSLLNNESEYVRANGSAELIFIYPARNKTHLRQEYEFDENDFNLIRHYSGNELIERDNVFLYLDNFDGKFDLIICVNATISGKEFLNCEESYYNMPYANNVVNNLSDVFFSNTPDSPNKASFSIKNSDSEYINSNGNATITILDLNKNKVFQKEYNFTENNFSRSYYNNENTFIITFDIENEIFDIRYHFLCINATFDGELFSKCDDNYYSFEDSEDVVRYPATFNPDEDYLNSTIDFNIEFTFNNLKIKILKYGVYDLYGEKFLRFDTQLINPTNSIIYFSNYVSMLVDKGVQYEKARINYEDINSIYRYASKNASYYFYFPQNISERVTIVFGRSYDSKYNEKIHEYYMTLDLCRLINKCE